MTLSQGFPSNMSEAYVTCRTKSVTLPKVPNIVNYIDLVHAIAHFKNIESEVYVETAACVFDCDNYSNHKNQISAEARSVLESFDKFQNGLPSSSSRRVSIFVQFTNGFGSKHDDNVPYTLDRESLLKMEEELPDFAQTYLEEVEDKLDSNTSLTLKADVIILGDPGFGRIYSFEEAASRVEGKNAVAIRDANQLEDILQRDGAPTLLVLDFNWTDIVPSIIYKALERDDVKSFPTLIIKRSTGSSAESQIENYFSIKGYINPELQETEALPKIINAFLEYADGKTLDEVVCKKFKEIMADVAANTEDDPLLEYAMAASARDPQSQRVLQRQRQLTQK